MESNLLTPKEVAERLRISVREVRRICQRGELRAYRIGKCSLRISEADLQDYLEGCVIQQPIKLAASPPAQRKGATGRTFRHLTGKAIPRGMRPRD